MIPWIRYCKIWSTKTRNIPLSYSAEHIFRYLEPPRRDSRVWQTDISTDCTITNAALHYAVRPKIWTVDGGMRVLGAFYGGYAHGLSWQTQVATGGTGFLRQEWQGYSSKADERPKYWHTYDRLTHLIHCALLIIHAPMTPRCCAAWYCCASNRKIW